MKGWWMRWWRWWGFRAVSYDQLFGFKQQLDLIAELAYSYWLIFGYHLIFRCHVMCDGECCLVSRQCRGGGQGYGGGRIGIGSGA